MDIKDLPKIELHLHLDGSFDLNLARSITGKSINELKALMIAPKKCLDLNDYLKRFDFPCFLLSDINNLYRCATRLKNNLINDNVIYAEVRFSPLKFLNENNNLDIIISTILDAFKSDDIKINLILCMMRNDSFSNNIKVIDLAKKYLNKGVVAVDLAGAESLYPTKNFDDLFKKANEFSIPFTIHAGEADGPDSISSAIGFGAKRIGHGVRAIEDPNVLNIIKNNNILLEICPTSNIQTNLVDNIKRHPIRLLYDYGINITVNTDNMTVSNTNLSKEYELLKNNLDFKIDDFINMNINAIKGSFLCKEEKVKLLDYYKSLINEKN